MKVWLFLWIPCPNTWRFRCYDRSCGQTIQQRGEFWKNDTSSLSFHFVVSANSISHLLQNCHLVLKKNLTKTKVSSVFSPVTSSSPSLPNKNPGWSAACRRSCRRRCLRFFLSSFFCAFKRLGGWGSFEGTKFPTGDSPKTEHTNPLSGCLKRKPSFLVWFW